MHWIPINWNFKKNENFKNWHKCFSKTICIFNIPQEVTEAENVLEKSTVLNLEGHSKYLVAVRNWTKLLNIRF